MGHTRKTSGKAASAAGKVLNNPKSGKAAKSARARPSHRSTGKRAEISTY